MLYDKSNFIKFFNSLSGKIFFNDKEFKFNISKLTKEDKGEILFILLIDIFNSLSLINSLIGSIEVISILLMFNFSKLIKNDNDVISDRDLLYDKSSSLRFINDFIFNFLKLTKFDKGEISAYL